jgi:hypothetical protein
MPLHLTINSIELHDYLDGMEFSNFVDISYLQAIANADRF